MVELCISFVVVFLVFFRQNHDGAKGHGTQPNPSVPKRVGVVSSEVSLWEPALPVGPVLDPLSAPLFATE